MEKKTMADDMKKLKMYAIGISVLAVVCLTTIAVLTGFKNTGLVDNTVAEAFIAGIAIFGTFIAVIVLAMIGKIIVNLYNDGKKGGM